MNQTIEDGILWEPRFDPPVPRYTGLVVVGVRDMSPGGIAPFYIPTFGDDGSAN